eukprot:c20780_g1_i2.p1 GENE.c20780_g1_i2~~c20780_g1_i2.p1  ORF type:complete len:129 (-),score=11.18 c20780_g1_i2:164-550(-)
MSEAYMCLSPNRVSLIGAPEVFEGGGSCLLWFPVHDAIAPAQWEILVGVRFTGAAIVDGTFETARFSCINGLCSGVDCVFVSDCLPNAGELLFESFVLNRALSALWSRLCRDQMLCFPNRVSRCLDAR